MKDFFAKHLKKCYKKNCILLNIKINMNLEYCSLLVPYCKMLAMFLDYVKSVIHNMILAVREALWTRILGYTSSEVILC